MEKVEKTFIGFLFALNNISLTILVNFAVLLMYYVIFKDGIDQFFPSRNVTYGVISFASIFWISFWYISYRTYKTSAT